ncbi:MAG TPA: 50S ribosomal protein L25/general stress protein Ctc [Rhodospirillales bacterium]|nr:50S ribosomal protein L25/general stress protein Ctc [Rhodospirillales bacterium]
MAEVITLEIELRERAGKGAARALRRAGKLPAIVYGGSDEPEKIALSQNELKRVLARHPRFMSSLWELRAGDRVIRALPREIQYHPVTDEPLHLDFLRAEAGARVEVEVPVVFVNEEVCAGLKRGGVLNVVRREVELECPVDNIPAELEVDLAGFDIGDSVHISHVRLPEGVVPTIRDRDFTICTIVPPTVVAEAAAEEAEEVEEEAAEE